MATRTKKNGKTETPVIVNEETEMKVELTPTVETAAVETPADKTTDELKLERDQLLADEFGMTLEQWQAGVDGKVETNTNEVIEMNEVSENLVETVPAPESVLTSIQWSSIKPTLDDLDVDGLKEVIGYCSSRIDELQEEEVEALEAEMRAIQDKLMAMRGAKHGFGLQSKTVGGKKSGAKRVVTPLVNPNNPAETYTFGKQPEWLKKIMAETGKTPYELRQMAK